MVDISTLSVVDAVLCGLHADYRLIAEAVTSCVIDTIARCCGDRGGGGGIGPPSATWGVSLPVFLIPEFGQSLLTNWLIESNV